MSYAPLFTAPPLSAFGAPAPSEWFAVYQRMGGTPYFSAWAWMSRDLAHFLARRAKGVVISTDLGQYRLKGPVPGTYRWSEVQGTTWGQWWSAKHVGWVYTNGAGFMTIDGNLQKTTGSPLEIYDTARRLIT